MTMKWSIVLGLVVFSVTAEAQTLPMCETYGYDSVFDADNFIIAGDAELDTVFDCYGDNYYTCQNAHYNYTEAYLRIMSVFNGIALGVDSSGIECLKCDITRLNNSAIALKIRHEQMSRYGYFPSLIQPFDTLNYYFIYTQACTAAAPPVPPTPPPSARDTGCDSIDRTFDAGLPGYNMEEIPSVSWDECARRCQDNARCKSFDWNTHNSTCLLQDANKFDQPLRFDYPGNPWVHSHCMGR
jgi:hypothetical protein